MATRSKVKRGLYFSVAAAFWFFLAVSAPHRVHHFFEQVPAASEYPAAEIQSHDHVHGDDHNPADHDRRQRQRPLQQRDCVILFAAQNAHASVVQSFNFTVRECARTRDPEPIFATTVSFNPAPFSQRAPPLV
ncbi:MAG TPA: hypothetical protein VIE90_11615 [Candidatus Binatia bacterium]|jgi:hypothetical protein